MSIHIRPISAEQLKTFLRTMSVPYGFDPTADQFERFEHRFDIARLLAAYDGDQMVATFGSISLQMTVPGATLPTAGTTVVSVLPTHRRQGILRKLMADHLADVHQRKEPLAALWASESSIYGRFGYGPASELAEMQIDKPFAKIQFASAIEGTMKLVDSEEASSVFSSIYQRAAEKRPGMFHRDSAWWEHRVLADPEHTRSGATALRHVLHVRDDQPVGYALFRTKTESAPQLNRVKVVELIAVDSDAEKALWQFIFGIDLIDSISYWNQPTNDPLRWWLEQPRRMERKLADALWIRPVDVVATLKGRQYSCSGSVTFEMHDEICPWNQGVYRLDVDQHGSPDCRPASGQPEINLTPMALGAGYLGGQRFCDLARAGIVKGTVKAIKQLDKMFIWDVLPWCQEVF